MNLADLGASKIEFQLQSLDSRSFCGVKICYSGGLEDVDAVKHGLIDDGLAELRVMNLEIQWRSRGADFENAGKAVKEHSLSFIRCV